MQIDYYYSPSSPWTYLGAKRFREMARRHGATIVHKPVDLGPVFAATGGLPLAQRPPARRAYRMFELKRWAEHLGIPLVLEPKFFPVSTELAARALIAASGAGHDPSDFSEGIFAACWAEERDIADAATLTAIADAAGLPGAEILAAARDALTAAAYAALTEEALARGVFGAPTFIFRDEPFWGQDRLDFLERALARAKA